MEQARITQPKPPLTVTLVPCEQALRNRCHSGFFWGAEPRESRNDGGIPVKFVPGSRLHGWDSARACSISDINRRIRAALPAAAPFTAEVRDASVAVDGRLGCWQIAPGGAGRNLNLALPIEHCTLREAGRQPLCLRDLTGTVQIDLSSLEDRPAVSVLSLSGGEGRKLRETVWLKLALADWCREHLDSLLSFFQDIDVPSAGQKRFACMEIIGPGSDMAGILSVEDASRISGGLQHILPVEAADAILVSQDSAAGKKLLQALPVFRRFSASGLESNGTELLAAGSLVPLPADRAAPPLTVNSLLIRTQPHLQVELDVSLSLPGGVTVHLTVQSAFEAVFSGGEVRFHAGPASTLSHYADIPDGGLTEDRKQEITHAVETLAACVLC